MRTGNTSAVYLADLGIEAYWLTGAQQPFPEHFHDHYVLGAVDGGARVMQCRGRECRIHAGHIVVFNPGDIHSCSQTSPEPLLYRAFNIPRDSMRQLVRDAFGKDAPLPVFSQNVLWSPKCFSSLRKAHAAIMQSKDGAESQCAGELSVVLSSLVRKYGGTRGEDAPCRREVALACAYLEEHWDEKPALCEICKRTAMSKSALIRAFVKAKGITPYRYLENIRLRMAQQLLRDGTPPAEAALRSGFSDQSHFTNCFRQITGLTPGAYQKMFLSGTGGA